MKTEDFVEARTYGGGTEIKLFATKHPNFEARLATDIATRFALVAGIPDGEDSAGRQKLRLPTAEELAIRSCDLAKALVDEYAQRDWFMNLPVPKLGKNEVLRELLTDSVDETEE